MPFGFIKKLFGGDTPQAEVSQSELANANMMRAMWDSYQETGVPAERERVAETLGIRYDPASKSYSSDPNARRSRLNADGSINNRITESGDSVATISGAYEKHRGAYDPDANAATDELGDIEQAKDESMAQRQSTEADTSEAFRVLGNAAGIAHGAQMTNAADMSQLSANQSEAANFNAANQFASNTNRRGTLAGAVGLGATIHDRMQQPSISDRLGTRRLHGAGR